MVAGVFSSVSRRAIDFEHDINFSRQHIVHTGVFRLIYIYIYIYIYIFIELDSYLFSTIMAPFLLNKELRFTFSALF